MPNDLDNFLSLDMVHKVKIDDLVKQTKEGLKLAVLQACLGNIDQEIQLTTSKTRFGGKRYWFVCPKCARRVGTLYKKSEFSGMQCRKCLGLKYLRQKVRV